MRIAFGLIGSEAWLGGQHYLESLICALRTTFDHEVSLVLIGDGLTTANIPSIFLNAANQIVAWPSFPRRWTPEWAMGALSRHMTGYDVPANRRLRALGIDLLLLRQGPLGSKVPSIGLITDFQHMRHPEFFTAQECLERTRYFRKVAQISSRVLLYGCSALRDYQKALPQYAGNGRILAPTSYLPDSAYEGDPRLAVQKYALPEKFIYLPSQFWKHKNHLTVFEAIRILNDRGLRVFLVCTGYPSDYRNPGYFADLLGKLSTMDVRAQVALLGIVPREHVYWLIRHSVCVLSASLFEGFGLTVDEARSFGKQVVLSKIDAHVEQNPPNAFYFNPCDPEDLASQLMQVWLNYPNGAERALEQKARQEQPTRIRAYAHAFMKIAKEVTA